MSGTEQRAGGLPAPRMASNGNARMIEPAPNHCHHALNFIESIKNAHQILLAKAPEVRAARIVGRQTEHP